MSDVTNLDEVLGATAGAGDDVAGAGTAEDVVNAEGVSNAGTTPDSDASAAAQPDVDAASATNDGANGTEEDEQNNQGAAAGGTATDDEEKNIDKPVVTDPVQEVKQDKEEEVVEEKEAKAEVEAKVEKSTSVYPFRISLVVPTTIYRGPSIEFGGRSFGGSLEVLGDTDKNGFTPVSYVRAGFGKTKGYIHLTREVIESCKY